MAFGLFKKIETADLIFHNGHVFTQDPELPWAEAVACKGEKIMGVGNFEDMSTIVGKDTKIIDLDGKYLLPGFIDIHRSPVLKVFQDRYIDLTDCRNTDDVLQAVADWAEENPDKEIIFGYGYRDDLKPDDETEDDEENTSLEEETIGIEVNGGDLEVEASGSENFNEDEPNDEDRFDGEGSDSWDIEFSPSSHLLSQACDDRPVVLLCQNCVDCWTNVAADRIVIETAEEEMVNTITVGYVLNLLIPFDFDEIELEVKKEIESLSDKGFTSVLNLQSPDYLENLYQDSLIGLFNEGEMRQRFFGSLYINRPLIPNGIVHRLMTRKTNCLELGNTIHANMLNLYLDNEDSPVQFSQDALNVILSQVCDRGFDIFLEAINHSDLLMAYEALEHIRSKGYKNIFVIASDSDAAKEETADYLYWETAFKTWGTNVLAAGSLSGNVNSTEEAIDHLTITAAEVIGMKNQLGSIESGKLADFAIFDENPLELDVNVLPKVHAAITVLGGEIVYDAEAENDMEMYNLMASQQL